MKMLHAAIWITPGKPQATKTYPLSAWGAAMVDEGWCKMQMK